MKFGSLKPSKNLEPAGIALPKSLVPQTMGTNSMPTLLPLLCGDQLYHHARAGKNAEPGGVFAATPRLQATPPSDGPPSIGPASRPASPPTPVVLVAPVPPLVAPW